MAKRTEIDIEIDENGEVKIDIKGIKGKGCLEYAEIIEKVLGPGRDRELTSEYYEENVNITGEIKGKIKL